jgi:hypothetical protein
MVFVCVQLVQGTFVHYFYLRAKRDRKRKQDRREQEMQERMQQEQSFLQSHQNWLQPVSYTPPPIPSTPLSPAAVRPSPFHHSLNLDLSKIPFAIATDAGVECDVDSQSLRLESNGSGSEIDSRPEQLELGQQLGDSQ